jgi:hypothetical protein
MAERFIIPSFDLWLFCDIEDLDLSKKKKEQTSRPENQVKII